MLLDAGAVTLDVYTPAVFPYITVLAGTVVLLSTLLVKTPFVLLLAPVAHETVTAVSET